MVRNRDTAPQPAVYLHIGTMKSGTTYLQHRLGANRDALAAAGVSWPAKHGDQVKAVNDLLEWRPGGHSPRHWDGLAASMLAHPGTSILSMEFLFVASAAQIQHMVSSLEGADLHVVLTLRDATSAVPSQWQTGVRSGMKILWDEYARRMPAVGRIPRA